MRTAFVLGSIATVLAAEMLVGCTCPCAENKPAEAPPAAAVAAPDPALSSKADGTVVALKTCPRGLGAAPNGLIDDAEDGDNRVSLSEGRGGYWWSAHDDRGSSIEPTGHFTMFEGGAHGSKFAARVTGKTAPHDDKSWGAVVGFSLVDAHGLYDASKYAGLSFFAKTGEKSGSRVRLKVADVNTHPDGRVCKESCYNDFGKDFDLSHDWQEYQVTFAELKQQEGWGDPRPPSLTPKQLVQIAWHLMTPGVEFDLYLDDVRFLDCQ